jgi:hypothetical protein
MHFLEHASEMTADSGQDLVTRLAKSRTVVRTKVSVDHAKETDGAKASARAKAPSNTKVSSHRKTPANAKTSVGATS